MLNRFSTERMAGWSSRRPKTVIAIWLAAIVLALAAAGALLGQSLTDEANVTNNPESKRASDLVEARLGELDDNSAEIIVFQSDTLTVDSPVYRAAVERSLEEAALAGGQDFGLISDFYSTSDRSMVSEDGRTTYALFHAEEDSTIEHVRDALAGDSGADDLNTYVTGGRTVGLEFSEIAEKDLQTGESIGLLTALIILALVFGAVVAAFVPVILAIASIAVAVGLTALVGQAFDLSFFVVNIITMMGLAVGIDYSLFIVSRYREERAKGLDKHEAITRAGSTATRAVVFSGLTVVLALVGMILMPDTIFKSLGTGAILVVVVAILSSVTLLPAVLGLLGDRVNAIRIPFISNRINSASTGSGTGFWDRTARAVMRKPVFSIIVAVAILGAAATPYFDIETGSSGVASMPEGTPARDGFVILQDEFGFGQDSPAIIVVDGSPDSPAVQSAITKLETELAGDSSFGPVEVEGHPESNLTILRTRISGDPVGKEALAAVDRLRADHIPAAFDGSGVQALVTGQTAGTGDWMDNVSNYTPMVFIFVLSLSFVLLALAFRSVVVPATSIVLNLLSVGAAYGLVVLVFQKGVGADFLGFQQVETVEAWLPLFLFSILFGLSMDYHVFLVSRIRERFDQTGDNTASVAFGLKSTAGLITGAAIIMVAVFGGFALGDMPSMQQMGFGLAVAVFLDATIVRSLLVPSAMKLLGNRNWYLPNFLRWLPDLRVEGGKAVGQQRKPVLAPIPIPTEGD